MDALLEKPSTLAFIVIAIVLIILLFKGVRTVPQGYNYTIERFRKYAFTLQPGLTIINPLFTSLGAKMNMMEQVLDGPERPADLPAQSIHPSSPDGELIWLVDRDAAAQLKERDA